MILKKLSRFGFVAAGLLVWGGGRAAAQIALQPIGTYATGLFDQSAAEIVAHDAQTQRLFIVNGGAKTIDVVSIRNPAAPQFLFAIDVTRYGTAANSVAVANGVVAVVVEANPRTDPGCAVFFDANGTFLSKVTVGAVPDMITFTPAGNKVLVANEGEPNGYGPGRIDPEGSVSIIDLGRGVRELAQTDVTTARFNTFNDVPLDPSVRVFGPGATVAQDFEPEYITVSADGTVAWVTLQENNALGILDVNAGVFRSIRGLGFKNHALAGNALDASDRDNAINIAPWPVLGMYQPDAIASFAIEGQTYLITANEGDAREYPGFDEQRRVGNSAVVLDPATFPNAADLRTDAQLGRLTVSTVGADSDNDGDYDRLYAFGARSFSLRNARGALLFDSGSTLERVTAQAFPANFNASNSNNTLDNRSDDKGPEPEGVTVGLVDGRTYAFIGLERIGGVAVYDVTVPAELRLVQYVNNRNFVGNPQAGTAGDLGPEGLLFISAANSPVKEPLLVVANEVSGTTTVYKISPAPGQIGKAR